jgi:hypothetical protein
VYFVQPMRGGAASDDCTHLIVAPAFSIERTGSGFPVNFLASGGERRLAGLGRPAGKFEE